MNSINIVFENFRNYIKGKIRKHKKERYELKEKDCLAKAELYANNAELYVGFIKVVKNNCKYSICKDDEKKIKRLTKMYQKYYIKGMHYANLAEMYQNRLNQINRKIKVDNSNLKVVK